MSKSIEVDTDVLASRDVLAIIEFATQALTALTDAYASGEVTYVVSRGEVIAAINPPEAGERFEHASKVMAQSRQREETIPVLTRASHRRPRRWWLGPLEGIF